MKNLIFRRSSTAYILPEFNDFDDDERKHIKNVIQKAEKSNPPFVINSILNDDMRDLSFQPLQSLEHNNFNNRYKNSKIFQLNIELSKKESLESITSTEQISLNKQSNIYTKENNTSEKIIKKEMINMKKINELDKLEENQYKKQIKDCENNQNLSNNTSRFGSILSMKNSLTKVAEKVSTTTKISGKDFINEFIFKPISSNKNELSLDKIVKNQEGINYKNTEKINELPFTILNSLENSINKEKENISSLICKNSSTSLLCKTNFKDNCSLLEDSKYLDKISEGISEKKSQKDLKHNEKIDTEIQKNNSEYVKNNLVHKYSQEVNKYELSETELAHICFINEKANAELNKTNSINSFSQNPIYFKNTYSPTSPEFWQHSKPNNEVTTLIRSNVFLRKKLTQNLDKSFEDSGVELTYSESGDVYEMSSKKFSQEESSTVDAEFLWLEQELQKMNNSINEGIDYNAGNLFILE